jgi:hypothetical protein
LAKLANIRKQTHQPALAKYTESSYIETGPKASSAQRQLFFVLNIQFSKQYKAKLLESLQTAQLTQNPYLGSNARTDTACLCAVQGKQHAVVAQIENQPLLCLSQAEAPYSFASGTGITFGGISKYSSRKQRQKSSGVRRAATTYTLDIGSLLKRDDSNESTPISSIPQHPQTDHWQQQQQAQLPNSQPTSKQSSATPPPSRAEPMKRGDMSGQGKRQNQPAKKQSKWSPQENAVVIELRGAGMKWDDVSKRLPGRSPISCRLHYQNYLERRSEWDEERKDKLARLYERYDELAPSY